MLVVLYSDPPVVYIVKTVGIFIASIATVRPNLSPLPSRSLTSLHLSATALTNAVRRWCAYSCPN